jgi:hypothetical protein
MRMPCGGRAFAQGAANANAASSSTERQCRGCTRSYIGMPTIVAMEYELVIKFYRKSLADEAFLATLEDELRPLLGAARTDGYDVRPKDINLFVQTDDPRATFRKVKSVLDAKGIDRGLSAAYRLTGGAQFTSVYPPRPMRKFSLD